MRLSGKMSRIFHFAFCILHFAFIYRALRLATFVASAFCRCFHRRRAAVAEHSRRGEKTFQARHAQRFVQPRSTRRVDKAVRPAAFEDEGPQLTGASEGDAQLRSIVVDREESLETARSAQLPSSSTDTNDAGVLGDTTTTEDQQQLDSQMQQQLRDPFGEAPPQLPGIDTPQTPDSGTETDARPASGPVAAGRYDADAAKRSAAIGAAPKSVSTCRATCWRRRAAKCGFRPAGCRILENEQKETQEDCDDSLAKLRTKTIGTVNLSIAVAGTEGQDFPFECSLDTGEWHAGRAWPQTTYLWKAAALCHKPLYFEDEQLERYGHSWPPCCQPFVSGAHFFTRLPVLPYCMGVEPPTECIYALGHYRTGSCAPYMCNPIPLSPRGALFQAGAAVGAAAVLP